MPVKAGLEMVILGTEQLFSEEVPIPFTSNVNIVILPQGINIRYTSSFPLGDSGVQQKYKMLKSMLPRILIHLSISYLPYYSGMII